MADPSVEATAEVSCCSVCHCACNHCHHATRCAQVHAPDIADETDGLLTMPAASNALALVVCVPVRAYSVHSCSV
jgi:hypothetical protein